MPPLLGETITVTVSVKRIIFILLINVQIPNLVWIKCVCEGYVETCVSYRVRKFLIFSLVYVEHKSVKMFVNIPGQIFK